MLPRKERYLLSYFNNKIVGYELPEYMLSELSNYKEILDKLLNENYLRVSNTKESISYLTIPDLKNTLQTKKLKLSGNKSDLLDRIYENFSNDELENYVKNRRYILTDLGIKELENYPPDGFYESRTFDAEQIFENICNTTIDNNKLKSRKPKKWYQKSWGIFLSLLFLFPFGVYVLWRYSYFNTKTKKILTGVFAVIFLILVFNTESNKQEAPKENITKIEQEVPVQEEKKKIPPQVQAIMDSTNVDETQAEKIVDILHQCGANNFTITKSENSNDDKNYEISSDGKILALALLANNAISNITYDGEVLYNGKTNAVEHTISDIDANKQKETVSQSNTNSKKETSRPARTYSGQGPNGETIKGNNNKGKKIYHVPGGAYYDRTDPEEWFFTEEEAQAAGYRPSKK